MSKAIKHNQLSPISNFNSKFDYKSSTDQAMKQIELKRKTHNQTERSLVDPKSMAKLKG